MIIFKIKSIYLLYIYVPHVWYLILSSLFGAISHLLKYIESQYLSYVAHDLLSEVICDPHVETFGDLWSKSSQPAARRYVLYGLRTIFMILYQPI
jgi:hypothetical protein